METDLFTHSVIVLLGFSSLKGQTFVRCSIIPLLIMCVKFFFRSIKTPYSLFALSTSAACDVIEEHMKRTVTPPRVSTEPQAPKRPESPSTAFPISKALMMVSELQVQTY